MSILAECPICHKKQSNRNKKCACGENLDKAKKSKRVKYWISYYLPNGKNRREVINNSLSDAQAAEGKRKAQKKENPAVLEKVATAKITFSKVANWYFNLSDVKKLKAYDREEVVINNFNAVFGDYPVNSLTLEMLQEYQTQRTNQGKSPRSIDYETGAAQRMLNNAFDHDKIDGNALKPFRKLKKAMKKKGGNARKRTFTTEEYLALLDNAPTHLKQIIQIGFLTGMRIGEITNLRWQHIDERTGFIRLPPDETKEESAKAIPITKPVAEIFLEAGKVRHIGHDYVFTYAGKPIKRVVKGFKSCCERAGVPYGRKTINGVNFHDIRHTVKTNMLISGIDKIFRDVILGHSLKGMDAVYINLSEDNLRVAMEAYTSWFSEQIMTKLKNSDQNSDQEAKSPKEKAEYLLDLIR